MCFGRLMMSYILPSTCWRLKAWAQHQRLASKHVCNDSIKRYQKWLTANWIKLISSKRRSMLYKQLLYTFNRKNTCRLHEAYGFHAVKYQNLHPKVRSPCRTKPECANFPGLGASDWVPWVPASLLAAWCCFQPSREGKSYGDLRMRPNPKQNTPQLNLICNWSSEISGWTDFGKHWTYLKHRMTLNILTPNRLLWKVVKLQCSAPERLQWGGPRSSMVKTAADWAHLSHVISVKNTRKMEEKENLPKYLGCEGYIVVYIGVRSSWSR